jgi:hypothetical protein
MQIEPLNLSHQNLLEERLRSLNLFLSEYSFANLYLFRHIHQYQVIKCFDEIFIKGVTRDGVAYIMPTSLPATLSPEILQAILTEAQVLFPIPESWLSSLEKLILQTSFNEADSDYLFTTSKLAHFPGRHLQKKRNLVNQLLDTYEIRAENLSDQLTKAQQILENWQQEHANALLETDYIACQEAIQNFHNLHLHGRIIYIDERPEGFIIGEKVSKDCYVAHFSKAKRSIKGLYQYLYQDLAQSIEGTCSWINIEQDLGISALRSAKHSYLPDQLLHKWRIQLSFPNSLK